MSFEETWGNADPDAGGGDSGKPPGPGEYMVTLKGGRAGISKKGNAYAALTVSDLRTGHEWDVLYGFGTQSQANFAKNQIRELGIPVDQVADLDGLDAALKERAGTYYDVEVVAAKDPAYDASTYVRGVATGDEPQGDIPSDAGPAPAAAAGVDTEDVPFLWREYDGVIQHHHNPWGVIA